MYLVIGTGSNVGNRIKNLEIAKEKLQKKFDLVAESKIYKSEAEDYEDQPFFYNQVLQFNTPLFLTPEEIMNYMLVIEDEMGRERIIDKGPRIIDIDLLFMGDVEIKKKIVEIPHPKLFQRSFVVEPLHDLPCIDELASKYQFERNFSNPALPIN